MGLDSERRIGHTQPHARLSGHMETEMVITDTSMTLVAAHKGWKLWLSMDATANYESRRFDMLISPPEYMPDFTSKSVFADMKRDNVPEIKHVVLYNHALLGYMQGWINAQPSILALHQDNLEIIRQETLVEWENIKQQIDAEYEVRPW